MKRDRGIHPAKFYTVQSPCVVNLGVFEDEGVYHHGLYGFEFDGADDEQAVNGPNGDDGECCCWDAVAIFREEGIRFEGSNGPSGGDGTVHVVFVPQRLIKKITTEPMFD